MATLFMIRSFLLILLSLIPFVRVEGRPGRTVVADSLTRFPLPGASILDRRGNAAGVTDRSGSIPRLSPDLYPITLRYLGFEDKMVSQEGADTIFLIEDVSELPEVIVERKSQAVLHILAFVREYSTLTTLTDTVSLFREKMVDFMLPSRDNRRFKGWTRPRVLTSRSYYRFTNSQGLDSVSDSGGNHFSWSDWVGMPPVMGLPEGIGRVESGTDTIRGRFGVASVWHRENKNISVDVDVLADYSARAWVPELAGFFKNDVDFYYFKVDYEYEGFTEGSVSPLGLSRYSYEVESKGRGHRMFGFNRGNESIFVNTRAEVRVLDKEFISLKEARKWERRTFDLDEVGIFEPLGLSEPEPWATELIARVTDIDKGQIRLEVIPDGRLGNMPAYNNNFSIGHRALGLLKALTGISSYKTKKNLNRRWNNFRKDQMGRNKSSSPRRKEDSDAGR